MQEDLTELKKEVREIKQLILRSNERGDKNNKDNIKNGDIKYANKWVESGMSWVIFLVLGLVVSAVINSVMK